jgi:hypothetical protein
MQKDPMDAKRGYWKERCWDDSAQVKARNEIE